MKISERKIIEWFLRVALSVGFLSAVADRFGFWPENVSAWGNWSSFLDYTKKLIPFLPEGGVAVAGGIATFLELLLGILLLIDFKTEWVAKASGVLLLSFALSMTFFSSVKAPLDYSVYSASAAAFALSLIVSKK